MREHRLERRCAHVGEQAAVGTRVHGGAVADRGGHRGEVTAGGRRAVVGLRARRHFHAARVAGAGADVSVDRERGLARVQLLEPFGRGDVRLGRDPALRRRFHRLVGVDATVAEELVEAFTRGEAEGVGQRAHHAALLVERERGVEVGVGTAGGHPDAARRLRLLRGVDIVGLAAFARVGRRVPRAGRVAAEGGGAVYGGAGDVAGRKQLAHLVCADRTRGAVHALAVLGRRQPHPRSARAGAIQRGATGVQRGAVEQPGHARALAGRLR